MIKARVYLAVMLLYASCARADDWIGAFERRAELPQKIVQKLEEIDEYREIAARQAAAATGDKSGLEGLVQQFLVWPLPVISVCFLDGVPEQWEKVASVAKEWTQGTRVHFEFGVSDGVQACSSGKIADLRVRLRGRSSWSEVGTKAKYIPQEYPTMQLAGISIDTAVSAEERRTILHEFGHALGFEHEHQNINGGCHDEFNWDYLYATLGQKDQVDRNMGAIGSGRSIVGLYATNFDSKSIMIYSLPPLAFKNGEASKCYVRLPPDNISTVDRETVKKMYSKAAADGAIRSQDANNPDR